MLPTPITETGTAIADIAVSTAIVILGVALAAGVYMLGLRLEQRLEERQGTGAHLLEDLIIAARGPLAIGIVAAAIFLSFRYTLGLGSIYPWLGDPRLPVTIAIVLVAWGAANFLSRLVRTYGRHALPPADDTEGASLTDVAAIGVKYLIWFIAILYLLSFLQISITPLIAGAGIAGIAVALAAQDVLSNLFGGVIILLDKPLRVGDKVRIDPYIGTVLRIGLRSTRVRTLEGLIATVPNSRITTNIVVNYTAGTARALVQVPVTTAYGAPVEESRAALEEIARAAPAAAPPEMELAAGTVQLAELGRFGPVFVLTFSARDETDPLAVKDLVYALAAGAVRSGRLAIGHWQPAGEEVSPADKGPGPGQVAPGERGEER